MAPPRKPPARTPRPGPPPRPDLPAVPHDPDELGRVVMRLTADVADARAELTGEYAHAYIDSTGTREERAEKAKQATVEEQRAYDMARAVLDGFKFAADAARWVAIDGTP